MDMSGGVAIVTGAAGGIGAGIARTLAGAGASVVVGYRSRRDEAEAVAADCRGAGGGDAVALAGDVADDADCRRLVAAATERFGRLDWLVNNAAATRLVAHADLEGLDAGDFQQLYAVNLIGPFQMSRAAAPAMRAAGGGAIVNISSVAGVTGIGSSIAYVASKGALNAMTLSLARALAPAIRVNTICPGFVPTGFLRPMMGEERHDRLIEGHARDAPLARNGTPEDIGETAMWLLGGSRNMTGQVVVSDGGMFLKGWQL